MSSIIYLYEYANGGVADLFKYLFHVVDVASQHHAQVYILINHPISRYLVVRPKYQITKARSQSFYTLSSEDNEQEFSLILKQHPMLVLKSTDFYGRKINFNLSNDIDFRTWTSTGSGAGTGTVEDLNDLSDLNMYITFTPEICRELEQVTPKTPYICIHYRMGDQSLENIPDLWYCENDNRRRDIRVILKLVSEILKQHPNTHIYFMSDNNRNKQVVQHHFPQLRTFYNEIYNPSYTYCDHQKAQDGMRNALVEFLFLSRSQEIHALSYSGFSIISAYIGHVELHKRY